jgi:uncharacterized protein (TIGR01244 family)
VQTEAFVEKTKITAIYNYRAVDEHLATSGQPSEAQLARVAADGFEVVINLGLHDDPRYALPDEAGAVGALGMAYVHIPVQFGAPTERDALAFFDAMDEHHDRKVWVHCGANMRVSAFLGLYRVVRQGWSESDAFALMASVWQPDPVWSAFIADLIARQRR